MKLGWKLIIAAFVITGFGVIAQAEAIALFGGFLFWAGVALNFTNLRSKPSRGIGSGKL